MNLEWNAPTKIKLIRELTSLLTNPMVNSVNPRYIQHLDQCLLWLNEYLQLNLTFNR